MTDSAAKIPEKVTKMFKFNLISLQKEQHQNKTPKQGAGPMLLVVVLRGMIKLLFFYQ